MWLELASLVMGVFQGHQANQASQSAARQSESQGRILQSEANREANRIEDDAKRFAADQKMMYIGSGVEIGGSAVVTLAQTDAWGKAEADSVRARGDALRSYNEQSARNSRRMGRSQFIGGIMQGAVNALSIYSSVKAPGKIGTRSASDNAWANRQGRTPAQMKRF